MEHVTHTDEHPCRCCCSHTAYAGGLTRRELLADAGALAFGAAALASLPVQSHAADETSPRPASALPRSLRVLPVLVYGLPHRREATSWRSWGGIQTEQDVKGEKRRIEGELAKLRRSTAAPVTLLPLREAQTREQAAEALKEDYDALLIYAAGGDGGVLEMLSKPDKWNLMFLRHRSGPVYLWYEIAHPRFLRKTVDEWGQPGFGIEDVVVDRVDELAWRLRALSGLRNTLEKRILAVGGASGWGTGGQQAPRRSRDVWKLEIVDVPYADLAKRIQAANQDSALVNRCREEARAYLKGPRVALKTQQDFVERAFLLTQVFRDLMTEAGTDAITINGCMGTIMPISQTTACLPLSLLNDEGYLAFCESDFVVIPSGILLHYISGKPVFLNDPTHPHDGVVTLAHCTAPRKNDGRTLDPVEVHTHFESDYGAAPKVNMKLGQRITVIDPDFGTQRWLGFEGEIVANPFMDICRSQIDVRIKGDCDRLLEEMRGFHWMSCYGSYLRETGYALKKAGVDWLDLSA